jgi:hypothetical protein
VFSRFFCPDAYFDLKLLKTNGKIAGYMLLDANFLYSFNDLYDKITVVGVSYVFHVDCLVVRLHVLVCVMVNKLKNMAWVSHVE